MKKARLLVIEKEYTDAAKGNQIMKHRVESNDNGDDEIASTLKEIRIAKRELQALQKKVESHTQVSRLIDKKYSLYRNRFILRTGEIPEMDLMEKPYVDVSFLGAEGEKVEAEGVSEEETEEIPVESLEESGEPEEVMVGSTEEVEEPEVVRESTEEVTDEEITTEEVTTEEVTTERPEEVSVEETIEDDRTINEHFEDEQDPYDNIQPDDYDYDEFYDEDRYDEDHYDDYNDPYDNPNFSSEPDEYDTEVDSQHAFSIDFPIRHSNPHEINVSFLIFNQQ